MSAAVIPLPVEDLDDVLAHTRELWSEARGQAFFVTGGTGFFGMWLLESFVRANDALKLGMHATVLSRDPASFARKAPYLAVRADLEFVPGDVRDFPFPSGKFPFVIHAATPASAKLNAESPLEMFDTIVAGTRRVLDFAAQAGTKKLLLTSSGAVYGPQPPEVTHLPESYAGAPDPLSPASAYGEGKRAAEQLCVLHARRHGYETKIARCFAFVGPHLPLDERFAVGNFIRDALRGEPIRVNGDGTPRRSYLYASDLAIWLWTILFCGQSSRAYNVGSEIEISIWELAIIVSKILGGAPPVSISPHAGSSSTISRYIPDVSRAAEELRLTINVPLSDAIRRTGAWHQS